MSQKRVLTNSPVTPTKQITPPRAIRPPLARGLSDMNRRPEKPDRATPSPDPLYVMYSLSRSLLSVPWPP
eukprot:1093588-Pyramimonas_sp.AAC.1